MTEAHSKYSASNFEADALCPGRPVMQRGLPDPGSKYADEGTAAHLVLKWALENNRPASAYIDRVIPVGKHQFTVDEEMAAAVQVAIDHIRELVGDGMLLSDQRVKYAEYLGVDDDDGWGTLDVGAARASTLIVADYKHGRGVEVRAGYTEIGTQDDVSARTPAPNMQMALYALGLLAAIGDMLGPFDDVLLVILQPRISTEPSTYRLTVAELLEWAETTAIPAVRRRQEAERFDRTLPSWNATFLDPNDKSCKFCRAKATCPALRDEVTSTVFNTRVVRPEEFEAMPVSVVKHIAATDEAWLDAVYPKLDLIEGFCKAVLAEMERRAFAGAKFETIKIVQGKRGDRAWSDAKKAEAELVPVLGDAAYKPRQVISPTEAEKALGKPGYKAIAHLVTQSDGKPHVAPATDKRPAIAIRPIAEDFDVVAEAPPRETV